MRTNAKQIETGNHAGAGPDIARLTTMEMAGQGRAVLFAGICGSADMAGRLGDETARAVSDRLLGIATTLVKAYGGHVAKAGKDDLHAVMPTADAAARAACDILLEADWCGPQSGTAIGMHVGFHAGTFVERDGDLFGDAANIAGRLTVCAAPGQILTTSLSANDLSPLVRRAMRRMGTLDIPGRPQAMEVEELAWRDSDESDTTVTEALHCASTC
jgi:class 3 adenylate cyclase